MRHTNILYVVILIRSHPESSEKKTFGLIVLKERLYRIPGIAKVTAVSAPRRIDPLYTKPSV